MARLSPRGLEPLTFGSGVAAEKWPKSLKARCQRRAYNKRIYIAIDRKSLHEYAEKSGIVDRQFGTYRISLADRLVGLTPCAALDVEGLARGEHVVPFAV
jgi:hypothetical protein